MKVLGSVRPEGYQIQRAGERSGSIGPATFGTGADSISLRAGPAASEAVRASSSEPPAAVEVLRNSRRFMQASGYFQTTPKADWHRPCRGSPETGRRNKGLRFIGWRRRLSLELCSKLASALRDRQPYPPGIAAFFVSCLNRMLVHQHFDSL